MVDLPVGRQGGFLTMYYVYILKSQNDGSHYVGLTDNIDRRLDQHNRGKNYSTRIKRPWELIHVEIAEIRTEARKLEKYFKSGTGREIVHGIESSLTI